MRQNSRHFLRMRLQTMHKECLIACLLAWVGVGFAQQVDSLAKPDYGINTTYYQFLDDVYLDNDSTLNADTILQAYHRFNPTWGSVNYYQDLGAMGSASRSVYYQLPKSNGVQWGMDAYSLYAYDRGDVKYYDTWSPYTNLTYKQGNNGQLYFNGVFSKSAGKQFNFGFNFRRFAVIRQIGENPSRDGFTDNYASKVHGNFRSKNGRYKAYVGYRFYRNIVDENGGVYLDSGEVAPTDFFDEFENVSLSGVEAQDRRNGITVYQQLSLVDSSDFVFDLFYEFNRDKRVNFYTDDGLTSSRSDIAETNADFYDSTYFGNTTVNDSAVFMLYENKAGIKLGMGQQRAIVYVKNRTYSVWRNDSLFSVGNSENYLGFDLKGSLIGGLVPFYAGGEYGGAGYNRTEIKLFSKYGRFEFLNQALPATFVQQQYTGSHFVWDNDFANQAITSVSLHGEVSFEQVRVAPFVENISVNNMIYFGRSATPEQAEETVRFSSVGTEYWSHLGRFHLDGMIRYYQVSGADVWRAPKWNVNSMIYYQQYIPKKRLLFQLGIDVRWLSGYYANGYMPGNQQFYLQDDLEVSPYPVIDVFLNAQIQTNARVFIKYAHVNQGLFGSGYQVTPYYLGQRRSVEFGFNWQLFN